MSAGTRRADSTATRPKNSEEGTSGDFMAHLYSSDQSDEVQQCHPREPMAWDDCPYPGCSSKGLIDTGVDNYNHHAWDDTFSKNVTLVSCLLKCNFEQPETVYLKVLDNLYHKINRYTLLTCTTIIRMTVEAV